uniref:MOXD2 protein n=1 Tax=Haemonchus contortus TaxID=6289 RepID=A0A7I4XT14_HAECO
QDYHSIFFQVHPSIKTLGSSCNPQFAVFGNSHSFDVSMNWRAMPHGSGAYLRLTCHPEGNTMQMGMAPRRKRES